MMRCIVMKIIFVLFIFIAIYVNQWILYIIRLKVSVFAVIVEITFSGA